ncbi:hypothetical protein KFK09_017542 [Dendrobium nobile]|uniref:Uncharacterized protein n=1 Tax=Dendrobium nobile TaxID=94219 RepID=A0A8T3B3A6_DENNO|nr:hypothetical protein KFK09_017542 [Dendrobium nobile]
MFFVIVLFALFFIRPFPANSPQKPHAPLQCRQPLFTGVSGDHSENFPFTIYLLLFFYFFISEIF